MCFVFVLLFVMLLKESAIVSEIELLVGTSCV